VSDRRVEVRPSDPCDRCDHQARQHHQKWESFIEDWHCAARIGSEPEPMIGRTKEVPLYCPCDGFVPKAGAA
jgi:hypothetical protein